MMTGVKTQRKKPRGVEWMKSVTMQRTSHLVKTWKEQWKRESTYYLILWRWVYVKMLIRRWRVSCFFSSPEVFQPLSWSCYRSTASSVSQECLQALMQILVVLKHAVPLLQKKKEEGVIDSSDKDIVAEAERLDVKAMGPLVLTEVLFDEKIREQIRKYRRHFLRVSSFLFCTQCNGCSGFCDNYLRWLWMAWYCGNVTCHFETSTS